MGSRFLTGSGSVVMGMLVCAAVVFGGCEERAAKIEGIVRLPQEAEGWQAAAPDETYDRGSLYKYIDGAAEVYLAYGFRGVLARRYLKQSEEPIVLDVFDMGSSEDAFGIFTFEREGPDVGIGQGSEYAAGLLRFWRARFFVSVLAERETPASRKAVLSLGKAVADAIRQKGRVPELISLLPPDGLRAEAVRYFRTHGSLSYHYFISDDNILKLAQDTQAVLARYRSGEKSYRLLLIEYPREDRSKEAHASFTSSYLPDAGPDGAALVEDGGWCVARQHGSHVMVVFDAPEKKVATDAVDAVKRRLNKVEKK